MDSRDSSPRSLDTTTDNHHHRNPSFDDQPLPKVKLVCSYGGRIQPRPHHNNLTYVAGDTKILTVDRHIKFPALAAKLSSLSNSTTATTFFKYQLPGEDLDALISVTNDEDLHHMMIEYDRLSRTSPRPARLRLFLFPQNNTNFAHVEPKPEGQWFVDALNSVQVPLLEGSFPPPSTTTQRQLTMANPDFLFGLDKPTIPPAESKDDNGNNNNNNNNNNNKVIGKTEPDLEHEIQEQRKMYIGNNEQQKLNEESGNGNGRVYGYAQKINNSEKETAPLVPHAHAQVVHSGSVPGTVSFLHERSNGCYSLGLPTTGNEVYLIQTPSGIFQAVRPVTGPVGQPVYLVHAPGSVRYNGSEVGVAPARGGEGWM